MSPFSAGTGNGLNGTARSDFAIYEIAFDNQTLRRHRPEFLNRCHLYCRDRGRVHRWKAGMGRRCFFRAIVAIDEPRTYPAAVDAIDQRGCGVCWYLEFDKSILCQRKRAVGTLQRDPASCAVCPSQRSFGLPFLLTGGMGESVASEGLVSLMSRTTLVPGAAKISERR